MELNEEQRNVILNEIEKLFETAKASILGRYFTGPRIFFQAAKNADPLHTLEGIYHYTLNMTFGAGATPNQKIIENLAEVTGNYFEAQKLKVKNHIIADVLNAKNQKEALESIKNNFEKAEKYINMLIINETRIVQAYADREGVTRVAADLGVEDPTVVFLGVTDNKICKYCKSMYHDVNNLKMPKPYKLSQVREGYFKPKEHDGKTPHQAPLHPHCRHVMSFVPPNFGFTPNGSPDFKEFGYDYYKDYWSVRKAEEPQSGPMADFTGHDEYLELNLGHRHDKIEG